MSDMAIFHQLSDAESGALLRVQGEVRSQSS
jgi:hypothetical protein